MNDQANIDRSSVIRSAEQQPTGGVAGVIVRQVVSSADSGGKMGMVHYTAPPTGVGPALHLHRQTDESFFIVSGTMTFVVGEQRIKAEAGTVVHVAPGTPHAFWNAGPQMGVMLITFTPAGFDQYFVELFDLIRRYPEHLNNIAPLAQLLEKKYDVVTLGPPPAR